MVFINELYIWGFRCAVLIIAVFTLRAYRSGKTKLLTLLIGLWLLVTSTVIDVVLVEVLMQRRFDNNVYLILSAALRLIDVASYIVMTYGVYRVLLEGRARRSPNKARGPGLRG